MGRSLESSRRIFRKYLSAEASSVDEVRDDLWNTKINSAKYMGAEEKYRTAILEQYKIYVEMADRVSARRALANTFFDPEHRHFRPGRRCMEGRNYWEYGASSDPAHRAHRSVRCVVLDSSVIP